jgi:pyrroline-5-carboxylate reductase
MRLGFIGTGTIASAIVRGLGAGFAEQSTVTLSPRNADVAAGLARQFAHVSVAADNQAVLDASDVVILAIRPQIARSVLQELSFREDHHVISLIATAKLETLIELVAPASTVAKAVPLPAVAFGQGPTAIFPPDPVAADLFDRIGTASEVDRPEIFDALTAATATMASYFGFAGSIASWLANQGVPASEARRYVGAIFGGLAATANDAAGTSFPVLATEHATPGGINEQLLKHLVDRHVFADMHEGLDEILARIRGNLQPSPPREA